MLKLFGSGDIKKAVKNHFDTVGDLSGETVVDLPAGTGVTSQILKDHGAQVLAFDLFPDFFKVDGLSCSIADLNNPPLSLDDDSVDRLICQEGIEHFQDQLKVLKEFARVLKKDGILYVTTPNISHVRARISNLLVESELYKRLPANELDDIWLAQDGKVYFGHIFLLGIQRLRTLAALSGLELTRVLPVRISWSSFLMGLPLYPLLILTSFYAYFNNNRKQKSVSDKVKKKVYWEILKLNIHPTVLFGKNLFVEFKFVGNEGHYESVSAGFKAPTPVDDIKK
ncbi:MAG: class I SAM-dependent methyltransferase [Bdellovibrionaceae bacterium]|jgi:SAM-dependent methyltransferase|nr:class I SAM-dependent methyltransferase [Pseudobdellovibrionaceae bacterium]